MATQLKSDFRPIPVPASEVYRGFYPDRRPNIRVAFSAGVATLAIRDKLADMPEAESTLDEIAAASPYADMPLRALLAERNAIMTRMNDGPALSDEEGSVLCSAINRLETEVFGRDAHTPDDAIAKLIAVAQVAAEGHEVDDKEAACAIAQARRHFGAGYVHHQLLDEPLPAAVLPADYDRFMRGPYINWQRRYDAYVIARAERRAHHEAKFLPAYARHDAVRAEWPGKLDTVSNPAAKAAFDAVDISSVEDRANDLVGFEHDALVDLLSTVAPGRSELATKLALFRSEEMWTVRDPTGMLDPMVADARRFAGHGAFPQSDQALLDAFAKRRGEATYWFSDDRPTATDEIEERSNAIVDEAEATLFGTPATTIEGVIAKLRTLYPHLSQDVYADHALIDPSHREFRSGLRADGGNQQVLWNCIEDLAHIGGVNLAEQGL